MGHIVGPFDFPIFHNLRVSSFGVVPIKEEKKFLLHHLSNPSVVNDGINLKETRVKYASFDKALHLIRSAGQLYCLRRKLSPSFASSQCTWNAFTCFCCYFQGSYFFNICLSMDCAIFCYYFELFSSFLDWMVCQSAGLHLLLYYFDNFWS